MHSAAERGEVLHRAASGWPDEPSDLLRLAAVGHDLEDGLDERLAGAPAHLTAWAARDPWTVKPDEARTLTLAQLVCLEQIEYESFVASFGTPMVLRDALTHPEDLSTVAAMVRWQSLATLRVSTPDQLLAYWGRLVTGVAREGPDSDPSEYANTLNVRDHLQQFSSVLSWEGQAQWREHIEPVDDAFRACTEHQDVALALTGAQPGGWWHYRIPAGTSGSPGFKIWPIAPTRYVGGSRGFDLRTISHVWELAERPYGLRAMTDQELSRWANLCARQAQGIAKIHGGAGGWWGDQNDRAAREQRRRADATDPDTRGAAKPP